MSNPTPTWAVALVAVLALAVVAPAAETRHYYVAAEQVAWDYAHISSAGRIRRAARADFAAQWRRPA